MDTGCALLSIIGLCFGYQKQQRQLDRVDLELWRGDMYLDSLDLLQICMAIKSRCGVRIEISFSARQALAAIDSLAATLTSAKI